MFHHLTTEQKLAALVGVQRVLRPGGSLHVLDFGEANTGLHGRLARLFHHGEEIEDHVEGRMLGLMREGGFPDVEELSRHRTMFGSLSHYRARSAGQGRLCVSVLCASIRHR